MIINLNYIIAGWRVSNLD